MQRRRKAEYLFEQEIKASAKVSEAMETIQKLLQVSFTASQSHMFRRGTASCLEGLGLQTPILNLHLEWSAKSNMLHEYRRKVVIQRFDKIFFTDLLQCNLV